MDPSTPAQTLNVLEGLYDAHGEAVYRYALGMLGRREDAEDAVQSIWLKLAKARLGRAAPGRAAPGRAAPGPLSSGVARTALGPWMYANAAAYSDAMTDMLEACEPPAYQRREGRPGRFKEHFLPPGWATVARRVMPNLMESCAKRDVHVATLDLMEIAFRLEEHRRETGAYPPSLDVLGDLPAVDPFSGGPYRYRSDDGAVVIYSVGGNGDDDGGTPPPPGGMKSVPELHEGDIVWRLP